MAHPGAGERMSDFEALMWELERSPMLSNAFANVTLMDRPPERHRVRSRMEIAVERVERLRQRAVATPGRVAPPQWVDDPDFDLDRHLRWVDLGGGGRRELYELVATLARQPFDRGRPLWEFVVIEGLRGGGAAMLQRMHHTITDGEGGIRLSVEFLDLERDPRDRPGGPAPRDHTTASTAASGAGSSHPEHDTEHADDHPGDDSGDDGLAERVRDLGRGVVHTARRRSGQVLGALTTSGSLARSPGGIVEFARSAARQVAVPSRCSPLWTERSLRRWFGTTEVALDDARAAAHALGGSINDFFVTGAVAAAAAYHDLEGAPVEHLRVSMPVSTRRSRSGDGDTPTTANAFAPTQTLLPTSAMDPTERLAAVHEALATTRSEKALGSIDSAAAVVNLLPSAALVAAGERLTAGVDFVCSNVRAAPFDLYMGGALMQANYPLGPLAGTAFNLTTMSYRGWLFLGLLVDPDAVQKPDVLLTELDAAYRDLLAAGGVSDPQPRPATSLD